MKRWLVAGILAVIAALPMAAHAQTGMMSVTNTVKKAPFAGRYYTPALGQSSIGFYGTDLGWSFKHGSSLHVLFGDSWADTFATPIGPLGDDAQGSIDLNVFPNGAAVDAWIATHPPLPGDFPWHAAAPPIVFRLNAFLKVAPIVVYDGGCCSNLLTMGAGKTPGWGFSNGTAAFGYFGRGDTHTCSSTSACDQGYTCDTGIGFCANQIGGFTVPCFKSNPTAACGTGNACVSAPGTNGGVCIDNTYTGNTEAPRMLSIVQKVRIGNADPVIEEQYYTRAWNTNKFTNAAARSVRGFDPVTGAHDYRPIDGTAGGSAKVFLWGRPGFVGSKQFGRDIPLYFAYVDLPQYSPTGNFAWNVHYYQGPGPTFTTDPSKAAKVSLNGSPNAWNEQFDVVDQMTISYIPTMDRWVMFYGGDIHPSLMSLFFAGENAGGIQPDPAHAIHARFATDPWGPWSAPIQVFSPGNPNAPVSGEYAANGMIHDSNCTGAPCVPGELTPYYALWGTNYGFLYAPSIIDPWTTTQSANDADVYWTVATWDPYETFLMKSHIHKQ